MYIYAVQCMCRTWTIKIYTRFFSRALHSRKKDRVSSMCSKYRYVTKRKSERAKIVRIFEKLDSRDVVYFPNYTIAARVFRAAEYKQCV